MDEPIHSKNSLSYVERHLQDSLRIALSDTPVVCLLGPRQCGKSTLAAHQGPKRTYISMDDANYLDVARRDPQGLVADLPAYVTIDEIQRAPDLILAIKRSVDADRRPGRFLLTGSANLLQLPHLADSLAGRMECIYLHPFTESEKEGSAGHFLRDWMKGKLNVRLTGSHASQRSTLPARLVAGGYPMACRRSPARARQWLRQYVHSILERDIHDVAQVKDGEDIARLIELLAHRTGTLLNVSELASLLGHTRLTMERYLAVLEKLFLIRRLPAWHRNASKRLVKTPKVHLCDSGLAAVLAGLTADEWISQRDQFGHLLESFVLQQLIAHAGWIDPDLRFWHYRDKDQVEVDCVITRGSAIWGVEVKAAATVDSSDAKGLRRLAENAGSEFSAGIIFYSGNDIMPLGDSRFLAVPLYKLWEM